MSTRERIRDEIDALPESVLVTIHDYIAFQKYKLHQREIGEEDFRDLESASMSTTAFWDNPDDEVWNHV